MDVSEAEKILRGVTPGTWRVDGDPWNQIVWSGADNRVCFMAHSNGLDDDRDVATARFIAWCREGVPALLAEIAAKDAALAVAMEALNELALHPEDEGCHMPGDFRSYYRDTCTFAKQKVLEVAAMKGDTHE